MLSLSRPIATFILLSYLLSWVGGIASNVLFGGDLAPSSWRTYLINVPATWGPAVAAVIVSRMRGSSRGPRELLAALRPAATDLAWIAGIPIATVVVTWSAFSLTGATVDVGPSLPLQLLFAHLVVQFLAVGLGEEIGWRGWLLPELRSERTLLAATGWTTAIWIGWHLPKLFAPWQVVGPLLLTLAATSVILAWLWWRLEGRLIVLTVGHVAVNAPVFWIEWSSTLSQDELLGGWFALSIAYTLIACILLVADRKAWMGRAS